MMMPPANDDGSGRPDEWDDTKVKIKLHKCQVCHDKCLNDKDALVKRVARCELNRDVKANGPCGLSQWAEFLVKFDAKMAQRGALLVPDFQKGKMVESTPNEDMVEIHVPDVIRILVNKKGHKDVISVE